METVEIEFSALPAHVRTARLVASAVARQCGVDEAVLDEVRLAVGEACSRAVELHEREAPDRPVTVIFADAPGRFTVAIRDRLPVSGAQAVIAAVRGSTLGGDDAGRATDESRPGDSVVPAEEPDETAIRLAVLTGLVDDLEVAPLDSGTEVRMSWPASGRLRTGLRPLAPRPTPAGP